MVASAAMVRGTSRIDTTPAGAASTSTAGITTNTCEAAALQVARGTRDTNNAGSVFMAPAIQLMLVRAGTSTVRGMVVLVFSAPRPFPALDINVKQRVRGTRTVDLLKLVQDSP